MSFKIARTLFNNQKTIYSRLFRSLEGRTFAYCPKDDKCDCTPDVYDYEPEHKIQKTPVMEKQCRLCSFWEWKPKEPKLMKTMKSDSTKKDKKKKRELKDCYPEMVLVDKNCPGRNKRTRPQWNAVFPNNVCLCKCKSQVEEENERAAAEIEQQIKRKRVKREIPKINCPGPDWDHKGHLG